MAASVGHSARCTDLLTEHLHVRLATALKKKKKVNGADWFPGPNMPVAELPWVLPSLLGQQDTGP